MQNDFVPSYDDEPEEIEETEVVPVHHQRGKSTWKIPNQNDATSVDTRGINKLCKSVDCLNTISEFVTSRRSDHLQELFDAFNTELSKTIEDQLVKRLTKFAEIEK